MTNLHAAARAYARRGWLVFPCVPGGKIPATQRPQRRHHEPGDDRPVVARQPSIQRRRQMWRRIASLGARPRRRRRWRRDACPLGRAARTIAADADVRDGRRRALLLRRRSRPPQHRREDRHRHRHQGRGGYVLAPPSVHPTGKLYRWVTKMEPSAAPAPLPRSAVQRARMASCFTNREWR
jgi:Bifunctional DNA primase/polymerase, N-terminal